ncbi:MAG: hypothetical protein KDI55_02360 [Anaerolineae bacterium]|nr:hypothetical protein [Anaerolineae bacterium]MCP5428580.1 hypothetical protein [Chromatiaceae bacterium]
MEKKLTDLLLNHIRDAGLPEPERELRFNQDQKWRFDFAWTGMQVAVEVEGGTWTQGRHVRGRGYQDDCIKYSMAAILGWAVIRVTGDMIRSGRAIELIKTAFEAIA